MALPTTNRGTNRTTLAPDKDAILMAMRIGNRPESASYLAKRFVEVMKNFGSAMVESSKGVARRLQEYSEMVLLQHTKNAAIWSGQLNPATPFQNMHQNIAQQLVAELNKKLKDLNIRMDFAVNELSQLIRGFSKDSAALDNDVEQAVDKLFNTWLANNHLAAHNGIIYQSDERGEFYLDKNGDAIKADPEAITTLIHDPERGFSKFLDSRGIRLDLHQQPFPEPVQPTPGAQTV